jgi:prepilin-type N-terminal cleavage/methylation domain-containing protein
MRKKSIISSLNCQRGFTLVEVILVLGVLLILAVVITMSIAQVFTLNNNGTAHMTAVKEVENAVHYLTRDAQMAQEIKASGPDGFPLVLSWTQWNGDRIDVSYRIDSSRLLRSHSLNGNPPVETVIVAHIDAGSTSCRAVDKQLVFIISSVLTGFRKQGETRSFTIVRRTG